MDSKETLEIIQAFVGLIDKGIIKLVKDKDGIVRPMIIVDNKYGNLVILD